MKNMKKISVILIILALCGGGAYFYNQKAQQAKQAQHAAQQGPPPAVVSVHTVKKEDRAMPLEYVGKSIGFKEVEVRARVSGILLKRAYKEGQPVKAGQLLFVIDPAPYKAALERAAANLSQQKAVFDRAKIEYDRTLALYDKKAVSEKDKDDAVGNYNASLGGLSAAQAAVRQAQIDLNWTRVTAPVSGTSSKETRSEGNLITLDAQGSLLTTIVQPEPLYVEFAVPAEENRTIDRLLEQGVLKTSNDGLSVSAVLSDGTKFPSSGKINFADRQVEQSTGSIRYRAEFSNKDGKLLPGQFVRVSINGNYLHNAILIPQRAVLHTSNGAVVYVIARENSGDIASPRPIEIGLSIGNDSLVTSGLAENEIIITEGVLKVRPGAPVIVAPKGE